jgi:hypothetical protein
MDWNVQHEEQRINMCKLQCTYHPSPVYAVFVCYAGLIISLDLHGNRAESAEDNSNPRQGSTAGRVEHRTGRRGASASTRAGAGARSTSGNRGRHIADGGGLATGGTGGT